MKRQKKEKPKEVKKEGDAGGAEAPEEPQMFAVTTALKKRLGIAITKLTAEQVKLAGVLAEAGADDRKDAISKKLKEYGEKTAQECETNVNALTQIQTDEAAESKAKLIQLLDQAKALQSTAKDATARFKTAIDCWDDEAEDEEPQA